MHMQVSASKEQLLAGQNEIIYLFLYNKRNDIIYHSDNTRHKRAIAMAYCTPKLFLSFFSFYSFFNTPQLLETNNSLFRLFLNNTRNCLRHCSLKPPHNSATCNDLPSTGAPGVVEAATMVVVNSSVVVDSPIDSVVDSVDGPVYSVVVPVYRVVVPLEPGSVVCPDPAGVVALTLMYSSARAKEAL